MTVPAKLAATATAVWACCATPTASTGAHHTKGPQ